VSTRRSRPLRILHIVHRLGDGGADHVLNRLASAADPTRIRHAILSLWRGPGYEPLPEHVEIVHLRDAHTGIPDAVAAVRATGGVPDIVHGWVSHASIVAAGVSAVFGTPLVLRQPTNIEKELVYEQQNISVHWRELRIAFGAADTVIVPSPAIVEGTRRVYGASRIAIIPNGIDVDVAGPWRVPRRSHDPVVLGFVGRLCPQKDPIGLLTALATLPPTIDWRLEMCGEGPLRRDVERFISTSGLTRRVALVGFDPDWRRRLHTWHTFLFPTRYEGMSNALLEAAAAGVPIVTSDIAENRAVLTPERECLMASLDDPVGMGRQIARLARDPSLAAALGRRARRRARQFTLGALVSAHEALYLQLSPGRTDRAA